MYTTEDKIVDGLCAALWTAMFIMLMAYQCHYIQCLHVSVIAKSLGDYNACTLHVGLRREYVNEYSLLITLRLFRLEDIVCRE